MGIKDLFHRGSGAHHTRGGDVSAPEDTRGEGTVGLADRTAPGGQGSPDTNQAKTEPMPPTPGHADPSGTGPHTEPPDVPALGSMNAGAANASAAHPVGVGLGTGTAAPAGSASWAAAADPPRGPAASGSVPADERPVLGSSASTGRGSGPELPEAQTTGEAHRAPGLMGQPGAGESVETDVDAGAARARPDRPVTPLTRSGDPHGVSVPSSDAAVGTSEEQPAVEGIKTPGS